MAEFATASAALGVVSTGITICNGLIKYLSAWKGYNDEVAAIVTRAEGLVNTLEILSTLISAAGQDQAPALAHLQKSIISCATGINKLQAKMTKYGTPQPNSSLAQKTLVDQVRRLKYPLKESEITSLRTVVTELQLNLMAALQVYDISTRIESKAEDRVLAAIGHSVLQLQTDISTLADIPDRVAQRLQGVYYGLSANPGVRHRLNAAASQTLRLSHTSEDQTLRLSHTSEDGHLESQPSDPTSDTSKLNDNIILDGEKKRSCQCARSQQIWIRQLFGALGYRSDIRTTHQASCPYYARSLRHHVRTFYVRYPFAVSILGAQAVVKITRGAGNAVIHRTIYCSRIVSDKIFPNFQYVLYDWTIKGPADFTHDLVQARRDIDAAFRIGMLPTDIDEAGNTLLAAVCKIIAFALTLCPSNQGMFSRCQTLLRDVLDAGSDPNYSIDDKIFWGDEFPQIPRGVNVMRPTTALGQFACTHPCINQKGGESHAFASLCVDLFRKTGDIDINPDLTLVGHQSLRASTTLLEMMSLSDLGRALILRSEPKLQTALASNPACVDEIFPCHQASAVHIATNWPVGLKLLLESGARVDSTDQFGFNALAYAVHDWNLESVELLIEAGTPISHAAHLLQYIDSVQTKRKDSASAMFELLLGALIERRKSLQQLATFCLPLEQQKQLGLAENSVLDANAYLVIQELRKWNVQVPIPLTVRQGERALFSNLGHRNWSTSLADCLFSSGFRNVNWRNKNGQSQVADLFSRERTVQCSLELFVWFCTHGAFENDSELNNIPGRLRLAALLGRQMGMRRKEDPSNIFFLVALTRVHPSMTLLQYSLGLTCADNCKCYCSLGGCNSMSKLVQHGIRGQQEDSVNEWLERLYGSYKQETDEYSRLEILRRLIACLSPLASDLGERDVDQTALVLSFMRALAFETVGLQHTCCRLNEEHELEPLDDAEFQDLREEEDAEYVSNFETLFAFLTIHFFAKTRLGENPLLLLYDHYSLLLVESIKASARKEAVDDIGALRELGIELKHDPSQDKLRSIYKIGLSGCYLTLPS